MRVYVGGAGARAALKIMKRDQLGRMVTAVSYKHPIQGIPWALDNGAYSAWRQGKPFDAAQFLKAFAKAFHGDPEPDFVVVPDIVAGGLKSLRFSNAWATSLDKWPHLYLAVQDGMTRNRVKPHLDLYDGLFVGGTLEWKLKTAEAWVTLAHQYGLPAHIGRVGTYERLAWAQRIGADSVDSSTFVQGHANGRSYKLHRPVSARLQQRLEVQ